MIDCNLLVWVPAIIHAAEMHLEKFSMGIRSRNIGSSYRYFGCLHCMPQCLYLICCRKRRTHAIRYIFYLHTISDIVDLWCSVSKAGCLFPVGLHASRRHHRVTAEHLFHTGPADNHLVGRDSNCGSFLQNSQIGILSTCIPKLVYIMNRVCIRGDSLFSRHQCHLMSRLCQIQSRFRRGLGTADTNHPLS